MSIQEITFNEKLTQARESRLANTSARRLKSDIAIDDALKRESARTLTALLINIYEELQLDTEKLANKIKMARRSPYGRISEMITMVASTYVWPVANASQAKEIPELQDRMMDLLTTAGINIDADLLLDIKEAKGYTSFLDQATFEAIEGIEPQFDELEYYLMTFADAASLPFIDYKMDEATYDKLEAKAQDRISTEKQAAEDALARHTQMTGGAA